MTPRLMLVVTLLAASMVLMCAAAAHTIGGDPMLGAELGVGGLSAAWVTVVLAQARPAVAQQRKLELFARGLLLHGHEVRLIVSGTTEAFVAGPLRPAIYVTHPLLAELDPGELRAVVLHEEHHRRHGDPLRSLALSSWGLLLGWLPAAAGWIERRSAHIEIEADRYALRNGATSAALASALLKCDRSGSLAAIGFASAADLRLRRLVHGGNDDDTVAFPVEWMGPVVLAMALGLCHVFVV